ncbi:histidinol-phosphate transaminase [Methanimicrococcus blatticola]|uniref:Histidinol-phosphate aminotransferase n=1 Tax=Methanimicrococcus blatticola TaxID=91560 RepID=A0A484F5W4_9EURY|nr:histidinol-phosphate transaminase [Methanimicrococcus blatticola]MBZ3935687.1 histidinol-phosphate transaminase [Methanimicrococcus blatticola]MCC2508192.1 histidinol-phosphate transaminase [Methanimicrococcus blatticola]TDQ68730.1 histidinol phosphate aminotransferase [Methanimicrococcus blatticola]
MAQKSKEVYASLLKDSVLNVPEYVPGKTTSQIVAEYGLNPDTVIKLNANENPLGPSKKVTKAIQKEAENASLYPTADASALRAALVGYTGFPAENIVASGPGMDSLIDGINKLFVGEGDEVIVPVPTFTYYGISAASLGGVPVYVNLNDDYSLNVNAILDAVTEKTKIIWLCSPNNPTGTVVDAEDVRKLAEQTKTIIFIDEAYIEFSKAGSLSALIKEYDNIVIGRTFSKAFGLAGMRLGYVIASEQIVSGLLRVLPPFAVSILAEVAAIAAIDDKEYLESGVAMVQAEREKLVDAIEKTPYKAYPSEGNFIIADVSPKASKEAVDAFLRKGIIIRSCDSFQNIGKNTVRITVGTPEMNQKVIEAFKYLSDEK